jgi:hypothetical protein
LLCINSELESKNLSPYTPNPVQISPGAAPFKALPKGFACGFIGLPPGPGPARSLFNAAMLSERIKLIKLQSENKSFKDTGTCITTSLELCNLMPTVTFCALK